MNLRPEIRAQINYLDTFSAVSGTNYTVEFFNIISECEIVNVEYALDEFNDNFIDVVTFHYKDGKEFHFYTHLYFDLSEEDFYEFHLLPEMNKYKLKRMCDEL